MGMRLRKQPRRGAEENNENLSQDSRCPNKIRTEHLLNECPGLPVRHFALH
jgi:hypothetical protein